MISFSICFLDNLSIVYSGSKNKNLKYFFHDFNDNIILALNDFSHIFIKLSLFIISFDNIVLVDESENIWHNPPTKFIIAFNVILIVIFELINKYLHFLLADDEKQFVPNRLNNIIRILWFHWTEN